MKYCMSISSNEFEYKSMKTRSKGTSLSSKKTISKSTRDIDTDEESSHDSDKVFIRSRAQNKWSEQRLTLSYIPEKLIGRREEAQQIYEFLQNCILNKINRKMLYISGVPGCGKTASTLQILNQFHQQVKSVRILYVNALTLKKPAHIYRLMYAHFRQSCKDREEKPKGSKSSDIDRILPKVKKHQIIVIDQFDFLYTKEEKILYNLFEWSSQVSNYLSYITISNTFDLPTKFSTKINSRIGDNKLSFKPYSHEQIKDVIADRLKDCPYFSSNAIAFASKKLAKYSSDIRIILNVLYLAYQEFMQQRRQGQIQVKDIAQIWQRKSQQKQLQFKNSSSQPTLHQHIMEFVARQDSQCNSKNLYDYLIQKHGVPSQGTMLVLLRELEEMGLIQTRTVNSILFPTKLIKLVSRQ